MIFKILSATSSSLHEYRDQVLVASLYLMIYLRAKLLFSESEQEDSRVV